MGRDHPISDETRTMILDYILMKNGEVLQVFSTIEEAREAMNKEKNSNILIQTKIC